MIEFIYNDGGREAAGFRGKTGDCVVRAIAIASELPYKTVYDALNERCKQFNQKKRKRLKSSSSSRTGVYRDIYHAYIVELGFTWEATMSIGSGCRVHLRADELPAGRLICSLSKHLTAVVDSKLNDTFDCSRDGARCVYGVYRK